MQSVVLLLGSNDLDASAKIRRAAELVAQRVGAVVCLSTEYRSEPYGFHAEQEFVNCAMEVATQHDAYEVLRIINAIEAELGRDRMAEAAVKSLTGEQYASRPIDIDIIFYGDSTFNDERLTIPYHHLDERLYALRPVAEIAAERRHPALATTPRQMLEALTKND